MARKVLNVLFYGIAAFYIFMMTDLLLRFSYMLDADRIVTRSYNLVPFKTIWEYISGSNQVSRSFAINNTLGNIVVFIPYGLYLQVIQKQKRFAKSLLIVLTTAIVIEAAQYVFGLGASDVDDVLLNSIGGAIGILGYTALRKALKEDARANTAITVLSLLVGIPIIILYFMTVFNHLRL